MLFSASRRIAFTPKWARDVLWRRARAAPSLDLRFADNKNLVNATTGQNLVTFTRASSGTYVDSQGVIRTATTNFVTFSEAFSDASWTKSASTIEADATTAPNGTLTADKIVEDTTTGSHGVVKYPAVPANSTITASAYVKKAERQYIRLSTGDAYGSNSAVARVNLNTGTIDGTSVNGTSPPTNVSAQIQSVGNDWYRVSVTCTLTGSSINGVINVNAVNAAYIGYTGDGASGFFLWGAQLEQSSTIGEYIPTTSTINSAPRFDHAPTTGESLGLLVEEQRTNLCLQSQDFATTWATTSASVSTNTTTAPDGTLTADTITASSSTLGRVQQTISFTGDGDKAISVWLKAGTAPTSVIKIDDASAGFAFRLVLTVTWTNGVASGSASSGTFQGIDAFPNGWYRIRGLAVGVIAANTNRYRIEADSTNGTGSVIAWGAQAENGAFSTSYIPTTTATVTRSADVASITGTNFSSWYRQDEGSLFTDCTINYTVPGTSFPMTASLNDGTSNNRIDNGFLTASLASLEVITGGATQAAMYPNASNALTRRLATGFRINDFAASINGGAINTDTSGTIPTVDRLRIGDRTGSATNALFGTIRRLTYFPVRLPNETLQRITQ